MTRITKDEYYLLIAHVASLRGTCARRKVGAIIVDVRGHIRSVGYNGPPSGIPNCIDIPCNGACLPSGIGLDECIAVHAEANALVRLECPFDVESIYITVSPCVNCVKLLLSTSIQRIVFDEVYANQDGKLLWEKVGRKWIHFPIIKKYY